MKKHRNEKEAKEAGCIVTAYDFDGTLSEYLMFGDGTPGKPILEKLWEMANNHTNGHYIVIYTTRLNERLWGKPQVEQQKRLIEEWLARHGYLQYVDLIVGDKPLADEYHDDRAIRFTPKK